LKVEQLSLFTKNPTKKFTLPEVCRLLSISVATGNNWIKLGKLKPDEFIQDKPMFTKTNIDTILEQMKSGQDDKLKSRRNKKHVSGISTYKGYIEDEKSFQIVEKIVDSIKVDEQLEHKTNIIIAEYALKLLYSSKKIHCPDSDCFLLAYLQGKYSLGIYQPLIQDLISPIGEILESLIEELSTILSYSVDYSRNQDFLGLLYISLTCIGERKATGSYYTPFSVVSSMIDDFGSKNIFSTNHTVIDPCCGTGNFLIYTSNYVKNVEQVFGQDTDITSVMITRINLALAFTIKDINVLYHNITVGDSLEGLPNNQYDIIIGNPPWGYAFTKDRIEELCKTYEVACPKGIESFSLFIENAIKHCSLQGYIGFVLPESMMNVRSHQQIRNFILNKAQIKKISYLGNVFSGVHCPSIVLLLQKSDLPFSTVGLEISTKDKIFTIQESRKISDQSFDFAITDEEYSLILQIEEQPHLTYLKKQADFALGIVTGDNKRFILSEKSEGAEIILRGSDLYKYRAIPSKDYIVYTPELFQQVAPTEFYRAEEKLLYRFICDRLVFAYDDQQSLSLNSGNILIPKIPGLHIKYILALLNSSIIQFYHTKKFASVKILRSHIEQIPIPIAEAKTQEKIIKKVDGLLTSNSKDEISSLYQEIDKDIFALFDIDDRSIDIIMNEVSNKNNFLF